MQQVVDITAGIWLLPSRRRISNLVRFFDAYHKTNATTKGIILVNEAELAEIGDQYRALNLPEGWSIYSTQTDAGYTAKIQEAYETGLCDGFSWIGSCCDDHIPETDQWDARLISQTNGWNLITSNDGWQVPRRLHGAGVWSKPLLDAVGYFGPPGMKHLFFDDVWETISRNTGCVHIDMNVMVRHAEGAKGHDSTSMKVYECWEHDEKIYRAWQRDGQGPATERVIALMEKCGVEFARPDLSEVSIMIACPAGDGKYQDAFVRSLRATEKMIDTLGGRSEFAELSGCADLPYARAKLFGTFLRSSNTHMLMVDSDMGFKAQDLLKLIDARKDFVSVCGPKKSYPLKYCFESSDENGAPIPMMFGASNRYVEVTGIGMAFVLITKACAERMVAAYPELAFDAENGATEYAVFDPIIVKRRRRAEDYAFCYRWRQIGGKIYMIPEIALQHIGGHTFEGCFMDDLIARAAKEAAQ